MTDYKIPMSFILVAFLAALSCDEDEDNESYLVYQDSVTGQYVVDHPKTARPWLRCPIGQTWQPKSISCTGEPAILNFEQSIIACPKGFELPANTDFTSVICNYQDFATPECPQDQYDPCRKCSICESMFGDDQGIYLSSDYEDYPNDPDFHWLVDIWDFGVTCRIEDAADDTPRFNVHCIKSL